MGSRFAVSHESPLHPKVKEAVMAKGENDTIYSKNFDGLHARVMKTPAAIKATRKVKIDQLSSMPCMGSQMKQLRSFLKFRIIITTAYNSLMPPKKHRSGD